MSDALLQGLQTLIAQGGYTAAAVIVAYFLGRAIIWVIVCFTLLRFSAAALTALSVYSIRQASRQDKKISLVSAEVSSEMSNALRTCLESLETVLTQSTTDLTESASRLESAVETLTSSKTSGAEEADGKAVGVGGCSKSTSKSNS